MEASPEEASRLRDNTTIDRITDLYPPNVLRKEYSTPAVGIRLIRYTAAVDWLSEPEEREQYLVFARDGKNKAETDQTEQFLQNLIGKQNVKSPFIFKDELRYWLCISK